MKFLLLTLLFGLLTSALPFTYSNMGGNTTVPYAIGNVTLSNGIEMFYREAGNPQKPTILLLHGFPSSSHQYRNLIPLLAPDYHVIAPDYPGFGFTTVPDAANFTYTFDNLAAAVGDFLDIKGITAFTPYVFDYGAPVGFRLALQRPAAITAIITQNGNAYVQGFGQEFWAPVFALWNASTPAEIQSAREAVEQLFTFDATKSQYTVGSPDPSVIEPEAYWLDYALLQRPGNHDIQLDLLNDYQNNVKMYPAWQAYLRERQPKLLAVWGKNDLAFIPPGAEAFKTDVSNAEIHLIDAGHFAIETNLVEIFKYTTNFLKRVL